MLDQPEFRDQKALEVKASLDEMFAPQDQETMVPPAPCLDEHARSDTSVKYDQSGEVESTIDNAWAILESDTQLVGPYREERVLQPWRGYGPVPMGRHAGGAHVV